MKELTKAEEQVMLILWEKKKTKVRDIINELPDPKPAYTTVSTIIRILESKNFVSHEESGKTHLYFPIITQEEYANKFMKGFVRNYFSNSFKNLFSHFTDNDDISLEELEEIQKMLKSEINKKKD